VQGRGSDLVHLDPCARGGSAYVPFPLVGGGYVLTATNLTRLESPLPQRRMKGYAGRVPCTRTELVQADRRRRLSVWYEILAAGFAFWLRAPRRARCSGCPARFSQELRGRHFSAWTGLPSAAACAWSKPCSPPAPSTRSATGCSTNSVAGYILSARRCRRLQGVRHGRAPLPRPAVLLLGMPPPRSPQANGEARGRARAGTTQ